MQNFNSDYDILMLIRAKTSNFDCKGKSFPKYVPLLQFYYIIMYMYMYIAETV